MYSISLIGVWNAFALCEEERIEMKGANRPSPSGEREEIPCLIHKTLRPLVR